MPRKRVLALRNSVTSTRHFESGVFFLGGRDLWCWDLLYTPFIGLDTIQRDKSYS